MATDGPRTRSICHGSALAIVALRVWREVDDDELRGRLIAPVFSEPTAGVGRRQLISLVERALSEVEADLRCDGTATHD
jgi:hypothetical protein